MKFIFAALFTLFAAYSCGSEPQKAPATALDRETVKAPTTTTTPLPTVSIETYISECDKWAWIVESHFENIDFIKSYGDGDITHEVSLIRDDLAKLDQSIEDLAQKLVNIDKNSHKDELASLRNFRKTRALLVKKINAIK